MASDVAIIGMAGRFPEAENLEEFWSLLERGADVCKIIPKDRFNVETHCDSSGKGRNKSSTPYGCFIQNPGDFDAKFFNMSPREATQTDPMQRLALVTAYEAMEMAGFVLNRTKSSMADRVGTFYGQTSDDWREINAAQDIDTYFITGGVRAFGPGRINYHFGFSGPSFSIDTACSSSFAAIQLACMSLRAGDCDTAFAGGMNVLTNPDIFSGLSKGQFLSKTGSCKTFDNDADGYCRGEGVVSIILKRLDDAIEDNDPILGVIKGIATNHSCDAKSITHPHSETQQFLFKKVMKDANIDPRDVDYVEMHGTGTQAGDFCEMESVSNVFAPPRPQKREKKLNVGSVKSNIGHGESVSGANSLVKALLMFEKGTIPPQCQIKTLNTKFPMDLVERNLQISFQALPFERPAEGVRSIFLNNFSAAGGNTALILQDRPRKQVPEKDPRGSQVIAVSAKTPNALHENIRRLATWVNNNREVDFASLGYTTTARRSHHAHRFASSASNVDSLLRDLEARSYESKAAGLKVPPKVAFVFSGQGVSYAGMGRNLFLQSTKFRDDIIEFDTIVQGQGFPSVLSLISKDYSSNDWETLSPIVIQLALVCIQMALSMLWRSWGVVPSAVIGHSLGEYAALYTSGVLSASDTIRLVGSRAQLLVEHCSRNSHGMLVCRSNVENLEPYLGDDVDVACINGPQETVLSSTVAELQRLEAILMVGGIKSKRLDVPFAFHSSQVDPILERFEEIGSSVSFEQPSISIMSPTLGRLVTPDDGLIDPSYLSRHCRESVNFVGAIQAAPLDDNTIWIEIGVHPICSGMIKSTLKAQCLPTLRNNEDAWTTMTKTLSELYVKSVCVDWAAYHQDFEQTHEVLRLPSYSFENKRYWIEYRNDWCLTKDRENKPELPKIKNLSTSVHKVILEDTQSRIFIAESDLRDTLLRAAVTGHRVHETALFPSSMYADMALTISDYGYKSLVRGTQRLAMNVAKMEVHKPLVLEDNGMVERPIIQIRATFPDSNCSSATVTFSTLSEDRVSTVEHAKCEVNFENKEQWEAEWDRMKFFVDCRVEHLKVASGVNRVHRSMAYKIFSSMVNYQEKYQGMDDILFDGSNLEATAMIAFQTSPDDGQFFENPYHIDSVAHLSGFVVNSSDKTDSGRNAYISHGWQSMRFATKLDRSKIYRTYVKMQPIPDDRRILSGDVYIFQNENIVGVVGGLKFLCVPRILLNTLFSGNRVEHPSRQTTAQSQHVTATRTVNLLDKAAISSKFEETRLNCSSLPDNTAMTIIAEEIGCQMDELTEETEFAGLGVDSLMSLAIVGRFREEFDCDVSSTLFFDFPTVSLLRQHLGEIRLNNSSPSTDGPCSAGQSDSCFTGLSSPYPSTAATETSAIEYFDNSSEFALTGSQSATTSEQPKAILLQGSRRNCKRTLFLLPDGSGSCATYANIPPISEDLVVYGLNSPFMRNPAAFNIGVIEIVKLYIDAVKRLQPDGPYLLGGWSAGGVLAYEITRQLLERGERVDRLVLIDSPNPVKLESLPATFHKFCGDIGLLGRDGGKDLPTWLLPHFAASVRELTSYSELLEHLSINVTNMPKTTAIWARDGIVQDGGPNPDWDASLKMPNSMKWLCENRPDLGHNGWERLVGRGNVNCVSVGGNHFTMMREPLVQHVGRLILDALR